MQPIDLSYMLAPPHWGVSTYANLREHGVTRRELTRLLEIGALTRIRRGWFALDNVDYNILTAVRLRGQLTGTVAPNPQHDCWLRPHAHPQFALPNSSGRRHLGPKDQHHLHVTSAARVILPIRDTLECIADAAREPFEHALPAIESLVYRRVVSEDMVITALSGNYRARKLLKWFDPSAESGLETLVRTRLLRRGVNVRTQVKIPGVGQIDMIVGDRLAVECDGGEFHNGPKSRGRDYARDRRLIALGYHPVRLSYHQIVYDWDTAGPELLQIV